MTTQTICDQCGAVQAPNPGGFPNDWLHVTRPHVMAQDRDFCSDACAARALGGSPETDDLVDAEIYGYDPERGTLLLSWPPSNETQKQMRAVLYREFGPFLAHDPHKPDVFWGGATRNVLDAIERSA